MRYALASIKNNDYSSIKNTYKIEAIHNKIF